MTSKARKAVRMTEYMTGQKMEMRFLLIQLEVLTAQSIPHHPSLLSQCDSGSAVQSNGFWHLQTEIHFCV